MPCYTACILQVQTLVFNRMCDAMFEPNNWSRFKDFARRVHNRADTLFVPRARGSAAARAAAAAAAAGTCANGGAAIGGSGALQLA